MACLWRLWWTGHLRGRLPDPLLKGLSTISTYNKCLESLWNTELKPVIKSQFSYFPMTFVEKIFKGCVHYTNTWLIKDLRPLLHLKIQNFHYQIFLVKSILHPSCIFKISCYQAQGLLYQVKGFTFVGFQWPNSKM